jgi:CDP-diacylglycerol--glycerol-3-phosphate 3-phosphatidyltransferase
MAERSPAGTTGAPAGSPRIWRAGETAASPWNVANVLTIVRILLAPVFVVLLAADDGTDGPLRYAAAAGTS